MRARAAGGRRVARLAREGRRGARRCAGRSGHRGRVVRRRDGRPPRHDPLGVRHADQRSEEHTSELQSRQYLVCRLLLEKKKKNDTKNTENRKDHINMFKQLSRSIRSTTVYCVTFFALIRLYTPLLHHRCYIFSFFFFNDSATTEIYTLSLHDALPICRTIRASWSSRSPTRWAAATP